jgi:hypothetical protein
MEDAVPRHGGERRLAPGRAERLDADPDAGAGADPSWRLASRASASVLYVVRRWTVECQR